MKCILLAAGYATRLLPLTANKPKALLDVGPHKMIDYIVRAIDKVNLIDKIYIVTNARFAEQFRQWAPSAPTKKPIVILDDHTDSNENRLGAIGDLQYTIEQEHVEDDVFVLAADNLFEFDLNEMVNLFLERNENIITVRRILDETLLKRMGIVSVDENMRVTEFAEKPEHPKSNLSSPALYIYRKADLPLVQKYLEEGNNPDAPGNLVPYMVEHSVVSAYEFKGIWYDIGTHESLSEVSEKISSGEILLS